MEQHIVKKYPIFPRKTIYINPNFKMPQSPHINPLFIYSKVNIHMNPQFLRKELCDQVDKRSETYEDEQCKIKSMAVPIDSEHIDGSKKVIKSLRVVHEIAAQRTEKFSDSILPNRPLLYSTKRKLVRIDNSGRFTNSAATTQNMSTPYKNSRFVVGKYKVDNRIARPLPKKISYEHINMSKRNLRLLNINGVLYKTTPNKLQRKDVTKGTGAIRTTKYLSSHIATTKMAFGSIFGKSVVPTFNNSITYTSASPKKREQCVRYSVKQLNSFGNHTSQGHLYHAKQRSLQILRNRLVKSNIPCAIFQRLGKCIAFERGKCRKVHDKIQVAICPRFLRGECNRSVCLLSHNVSLSKMPVCKYFLQGVCVRIDCPYLHKKLSHKAKICEDFLQGFCSLAEQCDKRHEFACPILQRHGKCEHPTCAYHKIGNMKLQIRRRDKEFTGISLKTVVTQNKPTEESAMHRYFDGKTIDGIAGCASISEEIGSAKPEEKAQPRNLSGNVIRPKLGALPPFISLTEAS